MWSRRNSVCSESRPKAFDMSSGIPKLPITSRSVDNIYNRVLSCKSISINYKMHGWFLYWQHATGWVWWKSGLRAVAMWSSPSFTKTSTSLFNLSITSYIPDWRSCPSFDADVNEIGSFNGITQLYFYLGPLRRCSPLGNVCWLWNKQYIGNETNLKRTEYWLMQAAPIILLDIHIHHFSAQNIWMIKMYNT